MENFALILLCMLLGYIIQKLKIFPENAPTVLNQYVIYIALPAMIFLQIPKLQFNMDMATPILISYIIMAISIGLVLFVSKILNFSREVTGSLLLLSVLGNTSFLGIPFGNAYFGKEALPFVLVYDQVGTFIVLATFGTFVASYYSSDAKIEPVVMIKKVLTFPPFLSLLIAFCLMGVEYDYRVSSVLETLGNTIVPLAVVAVGLQLKLKLPGHEILPFGVSLFIKLIIAPIIAFYICYFLGWDSLAAKVSIMEAGMGPMITAGAVACMAGLAPRLSSAILGYGILFSFITTAIIHYVVA